MTTNTLVYETPYIVALEHRGMPCCAALVFGAGHPMAAAEKAERQARDAHGGILEDWFAYSVHKAPQQPEGRRAIYDETGTRPIYGYG